MELAANLLGPLAIGVSEERVILARLLGLGLRRPFPICCGFGILRILAFASRGKSPVGISGLVFDMFATFEMSVVPGIGDTCLGGIGFVNS